MRFREGNNQLTFPLAILVLVVVACSCPLTNDKRQSSNTSGSDPSASSSPASTRKAPRGNPELDTPPPSSAPSRDDTQADTTPSFLLQGWIHPIASTAVRTYDFTQAQAAGRRTVEIRKWQHMGTLGWQINWSSPADYTSDEDEISLSSKTGYSEHWRIVERHPDRIVVQDKSGNSVTWFNCTATEWPDLIRASTRGCR